MKKILAMLCFVFSAHNAAAGIEYRWINVDSSPQLLPMGFQLSITFAEAAVAAGHFEYDVPPCTLTPGLQNTCSADPSNGIEHMLFSIYGIANFINYFPQVEAMSYERNLRVSIDFLQNGYLSGSIFANDTNSDFRISSVGNLFTVQRAASDYGVFDGGCDMDDRFWFGATGLMRAVDAAAVPEPASVSLIAVGLLGLTIAARRRKRTSNHGDLVAQHERACPAV